MTRRAHGLPELDWVDHLILGLAFIAIMVPSAAVGFAVAEFLMPFVAWAPGVHGLVYDIYHFGVFVAAAAFCASNLIRGIIYAHSRWFA